MTLLEMMPYLSAIALLISVGTAGWNVFQSPAKKNAKDIETLQGELSKQRRDAAAETKLVDDKVDAIGGRVSTLETVMLQMPDKDSQHRMEMGVSELRGDFKELRAQLAPVAAIAERMQELMMLQAAQATQAAAHAAAQAAAQAATPPPRSR